LWAAIFFTVRESNDIAMSAMLTLDALLERDKRFSNPPMM
jgi:hypothetical protein